MSDGAGIKCCTFCTILDRKHFLEIFQFPFFRKMRTFLSSHGNVGNCTLNRMEALAVASGTSFAAATGSEGQKSLFLDWKHLFVKIWRILERKFFTGVTENIFPGLSEPVRGDSVDWRLR